MKVLSRFLLVILYYLVATPVGLASRAIHDPLSRRRDQRALSYWLAPGRSG